MVAQQVRQAAETQKVVDALIAEAKWRVDAIKESMSAKQVEVDDGVQEDPVISFHSVQLNATQISAVYATSPPMMAEINVAEAGNEKFECDSAALHNIMSQAVYNKLRNRYPNKIPKLREEKLRIRLADGSVSTKQCGTINIPV